MVFVVFVLFEFFLLRSHDNIYLAVRCYFIDYTIAKFHLQPCQQSLFASTYDLTDKMATPALCVDTGARASEVLVLDGGFSSQLTRHVGDRVDGDPLWTARFLQSHPMDISRTHRDFLLAGADLIMTNTYQASVGGFVKHLGVTPEAAYDLITLAVQLAKDARDAYVKESQPKFKPLVVGSVGPYGAHLHDGSEYSGNYADATPKETMIEWHRPRFQALVEGGIDLLALETLPCQKEAEALLELLKEYPNVKAWMSFSCKDDKSLAHGEDFQMVLKKCWEASEGQLIAIGANCCSPYYIEKLISGINNDRTACPIPFVVYPNSGEKYNETLGWTDKDKCVSVATFVHKWLDLGVKFVGGCCRTYAEDITAIRSQVDIWLEKNTHNVA